MKSKFSLVLMLGLLVIVGVAQVAADTQPLSLAIGFEQALNLGDAEAMSVLFADDAVYARYIGGDFITGREAIRDALSPQFDPDRTFDIVGVTMVDDQLTLVVEISDHGIAWMRQTLRATVRDGLIQSLEPVAFRFLF